MSVHKTPIENITDAVAYYVEEPGSEPVRHEGAVTVFDNWVLLKGSGSKCWVPRENVQMVMHA